jgi:hypothetical protein
VAKQKPGSVPEAISASLLRVAQGLDEEGMVHQALPPYLKLIAQCPGSQEASVATERVLAIAEGLRKAGQHHMAMTVLDQLETAHQGQ